MNIKIKTALIIIVTLGIGIVIGALLNRTLTQNRIRNIISTRSPNHFIPLYKKIIKPDAKQHKAIMDVLDKHSSRMLEMRSNFLLEMLNEEKSMRTELDSILTPEQKKRLKNRFKGRHLFRNLRRPFPIRRKNNQTKHKYPS